MADSDRTLYGASSADYGVLSDGSPDLNAVFEVWDLIAGGSHITDLRTGADVTIVATNVEVDASDGTFRFYGPEFYNASLWIVGAGGKRFEAKPVGLAERVIDIEDGLATESSTRATEDQDTLANANSYAEDVVTNHEQKTNPHPQYVYFIETATGLPSTRKHYVGSTFPTPSSNPAPVEGDLLDFLS
jgi:hypothetical protein